MKFSIVPVLAALLIAGTSAWDIACFAAPGLRCGGAERIICASNGVTYENMCEFYRGNCDNKGLRVLHDGMCKRDGTR
ncbi:SPARC-related modular calcium-binding protein 1 [Phytophthora citrophthora]|uniref:SPARC-related modular calcium-binding protein 1 n=1 Tax=Phytophthora citrophthora TaxID=4793 RepID=A0AAD9GB12_9STRA|nr:SPARC-related modular calcium-binding protein 1 [Phytophthora citrophthora]